MGFYIGILSILIIILLILLYNRPVKTQIVYEIVKKIPSPEELPEPIKEKISMPIYSAKDIKTAYDKRVYSEEAVIEKLTMALLHKINTHALPPKYVDLNFVMSSFKHPGGSDIFDSKDIEILRKESTHQKLRNLGFKITIIKGLPYEFDDNAGVYEDTIKLEWN